VKNLGIGVFVADVTGCHLNATTLLRYIKEAAIQFQTSSHCAKSATARRVQRILTGQYIDANTDFLWRWHMPEPFTPAGSDLRNFPYMPIYRTRLFGSEFHARATDSEWRAGVTLWLKSWDQTPCGSLPKDDVLLCRLAELGRDMDAWQSVKAIALDGWIECSDGRLYHPVVSEAANNALSEKRTQQKRTEKARAAKANHVTESVTDPVTEYVTGSNRREEKRIEDNRDTELKHTLNGVAVEPECDRKRKPSSSISDQDCERVWELFPRKVGKKKAFALIRKVATEIAYSDEYDQDEPSAGIEVLCERVRLFAKECQLKDPQYIAHPCTWLNGGRYLDPIQVTETH
tara:strand:+ start:225 stop:1262 length:1038 start_codon:yes stop_codon:yes gene_type:complete